MPLMKKKCWLDLTSHILNLHTSALTSVGFALETNSLKNPSSSVPSMKPFPVLISMIGKRKLQIERKQRR